MYAVVLNGEGAHEPEAVYSLWTEPQAAYKEIDRLTAASRVLHQEQHQRWYIKPILVDRASDRAQT